MKQTKITTETLLNEMTGEKSQVATIQKTVSKEDFYKQFYTDVLRMIDITEQKKVEIFRYMLERCNDEGVFHGTQAQIADACKCSRQTVATLTAQLAKVGALSCDGHGVYSISRPFLRADEKRHLIMLEYNRADEKELEIYREKVRKLKTEYADAQRELARQEKIADAKDTLDLFKEN